MIVFKTAGSYESYELAPDELAYLAIQEEEFQVGNTRYSIERIPREGYIFSTEFSDGHIDTQVYSNLSTLVENIVLFFKVLNYD